MSDTAMLSDREAFSTSTETSEANGTDNLDANGKSSPPLMEQAKQQAHKVVEQTQQKAGEVMVQARDKTKSWIEQQMESTAENLGGVAVAVRQTSQHLREQGQEPYSKFADFSEGAAEVVEKASDYLREAKVDEMVGEVERFARRQPTLFLGIAVAVGFLAVRFLKSSGRMDEGAQIGYNTDRQLPVVVTTEDTGVNRDYGTAYTTD